MISHFSAVQAFPPPQPVIVLVDNITGKPKYILPSPLIVTEDDLLTTEEGVLIEFSWDMNRARSDYARIHQIDEPRSPFAAAPM